MTQKIPPPPSLPKELGPFGQQLNRWLLEIQSILNDQGTIDPAAVAGLPALYTQVAALAVTVAANTAAITANAVAIAAANVNIAANTASIVALTARNQVRNGAGVPGAGTGSDGDLYINNTGAAGTFLYGKIGGAWVAFA